MRILRVDGSGEGFESVVVRVVKGAEKPQIVRDLVPQRFCKRMIVKHQGKMGSEHLESFNIRTAVKLLAFTCAKHECAHGSSAHA